MNKLEARKSAVAATKRMSAEEREWASGSIADALSSLDAFRLAHSLFIFLGSDMEPNTEEIVGLALMLERTVCVPKVKGDDLQMIAITPYTDFRRNRWGILEPVGGRELSEVETAVIPMVAFDGLNRLGHGVGYYDRFLSSHNVFKIGIAFDRQCVDGLEISSHDVPMDIIITEKRIITPDGEIPNIYGG